jgi:hypothetical protein
VANYGHLSGTCAQGSGSGTFQLSIPIAGGTKVRVFETYTFQYLGIVGTFSAVGPSSGPVFSGAFEFLPQSGDCVLTPLTEVAVMAQGTITSS